MKNASKKDIFKIVIDVDPELADILGSFAASYALWATSDEFNIQLESLLRCIGQLEVIKSGMLDKVYSLVNSTKINYE